MIATLRRLFRPRNVWAVLLQLQIAFIGVCLGYLLGLGLLILLHLK